MIAYNTEWFKNRIVIESAQTALEENLINANELHLIREKLTIGLYTPNTFVRIGLFLMTIVICLFSFGFVTLFFMELGDRGFAGLAIFFGLVSYGALEYLVRTRHHYKSGVDDALLWISAGFLFGGISYLAAANELQNCILVCIIASAATTRFTDRLMTALAYFALLGVIFYICTRLGSVFKTLLPFVLMITASIAYFLAQAIQGKSKTLFYKANLQVIKALSLISIYTAGNYFIVRELSIELFQLNLPADAPLPFGWIFWTITTILPFVYLAAGISRRDKLLIRAGVLVLALTVLTLKFYFYIASAEVLMVFAGVLLLGGSYALVRFLAKPRGGFVYSEAQEKESIQLESLIIAETFSPVPAQTEATRFGGGSFGGAGSSGEF